MMGGMTTAPGQVSVAQQGLRHPLDPDPVRATKARAVFALGLLGVLTGLVHRRGGAGHGGAAAGPAGAPGGVRLGGFPRPAAAWLRRGERMAWAGLVLVAVTVVVAGGDRAWSGWPVPVGQDYAANMD